MSVVIAVASSKGGVGKTTTVINLGESLAQLGYRVLLIELDPQNGLTLGLGLDSLRNEPGLFDALREGEPVDERVIGLDTEGLDVLPGGPTGSVTELNRITAAGPERVQAIVAALRDRYHYIFLDCPAGFSGLAASALAAADQALLPVQCEPLALRTLPVMLEQVQEFRQAINPRLSLCGVLLTMYDPVTDATERVAEQVWSRFPASAVFAIAIPRSNQFVSQYRTGSAVAYALPRTAGAQAYMQLARELVERQAAS